MNHTSIISSRKLFTLFCKKKLYQASSFNVYHQIIQNTKNAVVYHNNHTRRTIILYSKTRIHHVSSHSVLRCTLFFGLKGKQRCSRPFLYCSFPRGFRIRNMTSDTFMEQSLTKYECEKNIS